ncbi:phage head spike fiber domain-containing protein [Roseococcus sp.]|uniref:phage head spike fiber domain-containing protein n=1 Tax=Roseococcus sp. TaxID=2109646 RepID=UPI003BAB2126
MIPSLCAPILSLRRKAFPLSADGYLSPGFTFSRATAATFVDRSGVVSLVGPNVPRFQDGRLLMEGDRVNLWTNSQQLPAAAGLGTGYSTAAVEAAFTYAYGAQTDYAGRGVLGKAIRFNGAPAAAGVTRPMSYTMAAASMAADTEYAISRYAAWTGVGTPTGVTTILRSLGALSNPTGPSFDYSDTALRRYVIQRVTTSVPDAISIQQNSNYLAGANDLEQFIGGDQFEAGLFPSSLIPTTGGAATRSRDICAGPLIGLGLPAMGFTLYGSTVFVGAGQSSIHQPIFTVDAGATTARWSLYADGTGVRIRKDGGGNTAIPIGTMTPGVVLRWAASFDLINMVMSACVAGGAVGTQGSPGVAMTHLRIGNSASTAAPGFNASAIWALPYAATAMQLPSIAAGAP